MARKNGKYMLRWPRGRRSYVTEMGKLLRWLKMMNVTEYIKAECSPPCSIANVESTRGGRRGLCNIQNFYWMKA